MLFLMADHVAELAKSARNYREVRVRSAAVKIELAEAVRTAYAHGMRKADILRAIDHVWSREWLDRILDELPPDRAPRLEIVTEEPPNHRSRPRPRPLDR